MSVSLSFHLLRTFKTRGKAYPHWKKSCLLRQIFCHHQHFTSADGLSQLDKFWPKLANLQTDRRQNLSVASVSPWGEGGRGEGRATRRLGKPHLNPSPIFPQSEKRASAAYSANNKNLLVNYLSR